MNAHSVDTEPGGLPPDSAHPDDLATQAEPTHAPHTRMLEMEMDLGWSDYGDPAPAIHPSGAELRRRLITPESLAEEPEAPPSLLQRITGSIRDALGRR